MASINTGRFILGGLAAGLVVNVVESVVNIFVLAEPMEEMLASMNLPPLGGGAMGGFVLLGFSLGFLVVWMYAAIRPRYGPGPGTAMKAGLGAWAAFYLLSVWGNWLMGIATLSLSSITLAYTLPMMLAAGYVGAMVYKEE